MTQDNTVKQNKAKEKGISSVHVEESMQRLAMMMSGL
jgi:hypothetical protein